MISHFKELKVWQKSMDLVIEIYGLVQLLPKYENYALSDQMRRAAVSIPSNIAEGQQRRSAKEFVRFLLIARGSCAELETQLSVCVALKYLTDAQIKNASSMLDEIGRMLSGLVAKLEYAGITTEKKN